MWSSRCALLQRVEGTRAGTELWNAGRLHAPNMEMKTNLKTVGNFGHSTDCSAKELLLAKCPVVTCGCLLDASRAPVWPVIGPAGRFGRAVN